MYTRKKVIFPTRVFYSPRLHLDPHTAHSLVIGWFLTFVNNVVLLLMQVIVIKLLYIALFMIVLTVNDSM